MSFRPSVFTLLAASAIAGLPARAEAWSRIDIKSNSDIVLKGSQIKVRELSDTGGGTSASNGFVLKKKQSYLIAAPRSSTQWSMYFYYATDAGKADSTLPSLKVGADSGSVNLAFKFPSGIPKGQPQDFPSVAVNTKAMGAYKAGSNKVAFLTVGILSTLAGGGSGGGGGQASGGSDGTSASGGSSSGGSDPSSQPDPNS
ncbi:MAG TPA: hypothetical protein VK188_15555 [Holophaga sp.]|nr:hypothetical protein [Holophaga sp.]